MKTTKKTFKIEIIVNASTKEEKDIHYGMLRFYLEQSYKMANLLVNNLYTNFDISNRIISKNPEFKARMLSNKKELDELDIKYKTLSRKEKNEKEIIINRKRELWEDNKKLKQEVIDLEKGFYINTGSELSKAGNLPIQQTSERVLAEQFSNISSYIRGGISNNVYKCYKRERKELIMGNRTVRTYKKGMPIFFKKTAIRNFEYDVNIKSIVFTWVEIPFAIRFGRDTSNNKAVILKIIQNEYTLCDSSIIMRDDKWFLNLVVDMPVKEQPNLSLDIIVGADLGVVNPLHVCSTNDKWGIKIGNKKSFFDKKKSFFNQRKSLSKSLSQRKGGHGYNTKMEKLIKLKFAEKNYTSTLIHTYVKELIDYAIKVGGGIIKMESLSSLTSEETFKKTLGRFFPVRELQTMIEQKALLNGIIVKYINPYMTSQTCCKCGNTESGQRINRDIFVCNNQSCDAYNKKWDADRNAANNICKSENYIIQENDEKKLENVLVDSN